MVNKSHPLPRQTSSGCPDDDAVRPKRRRLDPQQREQEILEGAIRYFSEVGFEGSMRDLAARLGTSHALLFRYFPTKDALVDRVYDRMFLSRWDSAWDDLLQRQSVPFPERLVSFYVQYLRVVDRPEWVRTFVYAGLAGMSINQRYLKLIRLKVIVPIAEELIRLRASSRHDRRSANDVMNEAIEMSWGLHGEIFYIAIRRWIYGIDVTKDRDAFVALTIGKFLEGAPDALSRPRS